MYSNTFVILTYVNPVANTVIFLYLITMSVLIKFKNINLPFLSMNRITKHIEYMNMYLTNEHSQIYPAVNEQNDPPQCII